MFRIYKIGEGEDIESIANKFSTTSSEILELNGFDRDYRAMSGNLLIVPNNSTLFRKYRVQKGDTIYELAKKTNVDMSTLLKINGLDADDYIYPNQELLLPASNVSLYVTSNNETLTDVASHFKTGKDNIVAMNEDLALAPDQLIVYKKESL